MCLKIKEIFKEVYDRDIDCNSLKDQIMTHKAVYLLDSMGVYVGDYSFIWYKHGPFSVDLQEDIFAVKDKEIQSLNLRTYARKKLDILKEIVSKCPEDLEQYRWMELVASMHYLKKYVCRGASSNDVISKKLVELKKHFENMQDNINLGFDCLNLLA